MIVNVELKRIAHSLRCSFLAAQFWYRRFAPVEELSAGLGRILAY